jgi:4-amino-4-deoxy-L-arabinose transferase-like glycosyltransferase
VTRSWAALIVLVALLHAGAYIVHQQPDWSNDRIFSDQGEFELLGKNLLKYGRFTRYPTGVPPITESERMPGYPLILATLYAVCGESRMVVVVFQAGLFAALCLVVGSIGAMLWSPALGRAAGLAAALYPPFPYWSAVALTETLATLLLTVALWCLLRGIRSARVPTFVGAGLAFGYLTITRPAWALLAPLLALVVLVIERRAVRTLLPRLVVMGAAMALIVVPWVGFVYTHFNVVRLNPVAFWRTAYWGYWQGVFPARVSVKLDAIVESNLQGEALIAALREIGPDVPRMTTYVNDSRRIGSVWHGQTDVNALTTAKMGIEGMSRAIILGHLRDGDLGSFIYRRLTYGTFALWIADIPMRYSLINAIPVGVIRAIELAHVVVLGLAAWGAVVLYRGQRLPGALMLAALLYTELVHVFIHTDIRFSLPVKPMVVLLAVFAVSRLAGVRSAHSVRAIPAEVAR